MRPNMQYFTNSCYYWGKNPTPYYRNEDTLTITETSSEPIISDDSIYIS